MATRLMVVAPPGIKPSDLVKQRRTIEGLPYDVLIHLEALALLAAQGNIIAADILTAERVRLGIDRPMFSFRR